MQTIKSVAAGLYVAVTAAGTLFFSAAIQPAQAVLIDWTLSVDFDDSSSATGGFTYDTAAISFSNILVTLTGGLYGPRSFSQVAPGSSASHLPLLDPADGPDFTGDPVFDLFVSTDFGDLTTSMGPVWIGLCVQDVCSSRNIATAWAAGSSPSFEGRIVAAPEPGTLAIFGLGLAGLGFMRRRRKLN